MKKNIFLLGVISASFVVSILFIIFEDNNYTNLSFKYKYETENRYVYEDRKVLLVGNYKYRAKRVLDEYFLGPLSVFNKKTVPYYFTYNKFYVNGSTAYLDLPVSIIKISENNNMSLDETFELITFNIIKNTKRIKEVIITVDGQTIGSGPSLLELPGKLIE